MVAADQVMQADAMDRLGLRQLLLEPEMLRTVQPDIGLVSTLDDLNAAAEDMHHRFLRIGLPCTIHPDPMTQAISAALSGPGVVAIAVMRLACAAWHGEHWAPAVVPGAISTTSAGSSSAPPLQPNTRRPSWRV